jgi:endoglucanase
MVTPNDAWVSPATRRRSAAHMAAILLAWLLPVGHLASAPALAENGVRIDGRTLVRDGRPWAPRGVVIVSFVAPVAELAPAYADAHQRFRSEGLLEEAKRFGADSIRFQVSQPGLDPQSEIYDPDYRNTIRDAVAAARAEGFAVIVSMQWQRPSGIAGLPGRPTDSTERAWNALLDVLPNDPELMFELLNEPKGNRADPETWPDWKQGMERLVADLRAKGRGNVLIADGVEAGTTLDGAPDIADPKGQIAYAVHPYFWPKNRDLSGWTQNFGDFAADHVVIVTEWNITSRMQCDALSAERIGSFLDYLAARRIGLFLWALGYAQTVYNRRGELIDAKGVHCGSPGFGAARMVSDRFLAR